MINVLTQNVLFPLLDFAHISKLLIDEILSKNYNYSKLSLVSKV